MKIKPTQKSLDLLREVAKSLDEATMHHIYHVLMDVAWSYPDDQELNFVEIGTAYGCTSCFMLQRKHTNVITIDNRMMPVAEGLVEANIIKSNIHGNFVRYLIGDSQTQEMADAVKYLMGGIDILFIDGDHTEEGVINDFKFYSPMVKNGGYVVFDDYGDYRYSPTVKIGVDKIIANMNGGWELQGMPDNLLGARPDDQPEGNEYIMRKL